MINNNDTLVGDIKCESIEECIILQTFLHLKGCVWFTGRGLNNAYYFLDCKWKYFVYTVNSLHSVTYSMERGGYCPTNTISFKEYMAKNKMVLGAYAKLLRSMPPTLKVAYEVQRKLLH